MKYDIYYGDPTIRFALGNTGKRPLVVMGINPSKADSSRPDPTIRKVEQQLRVWKEFDGFLMLNLYPVRAKKPNQLPPFDGRLAALNAEFIRVQLSQFSQRTVWAAWGDSIDAKEAKGFFVSCLCKIVAFVSGLDVSWQKCESLSDSQNPRYPLSGRPHVVNQLSHLDDFDIGKYLGQKTSFRTK